MRAIQGLSVVIFCLLSAGIKADTLPPVTGLMLDGNQLVWDAQSGASGYNVHLNYEYFDTVRRKTNYTVSEPGKYHVVSFNDSGEFGVTRTPEEGGTPYRNVEYTADAQTTLPKITGLALTDNQLSWDEQSGVSGYNIHLNYQYFDTVRGTTSYTVVEPGRYHVISFNDNGLYGVTRTPEEGGTPYTFFEYTVTSLPKVTGLELDGDMLNWDAQAGATGYNIHLNYQYFDTVRDTEAYVVTVPGRYHVISFNDKGQFGVSRSADEIGLPYTFVEFEGP